MDNSRSRESDWRADTWRVLQCREKMHRKWGLYSAQIDVIWHLLTFIDIYWTGWSTRWDSLVVWKQNAAESVGLSRSTTTTFYFELTHLLMYFNFSCNNLARENGVEASGLLGIHEQAWMASRMLVAGVFFFCFYLEKNTSSFTLPWWV